MAALPAGRADPQKPLSPVHLSRFTYLVDKNSGETRSWSAVSVCCMIMQLVGVCSHHTPTGVWWDLSMQRRSC